MNKNFDIITESTIENIRSMCQKMIEAQMKDVSSIEELKKAISFLFAELKTKVDILHYNNNQIMETLWKN